MEQLSIVGGIIGGIVGILALIGMISRRMDKYLFKKIVKWKAELHGANKDAEIPDMLWTMYFEMKLLQFSIGIVFFFVIWYEFDDTFWGIVIWMIKYLMNGDSPESVEP